MEGSGAHRERPGSKFTVSSDLSDARYVLTSYLPTDGNSCGFDNMGAF